MLARHSLAYLLVRGLPGLVNFLALAIYTRLVSPEEYGHYALILATVSLLNSLIFQWLRLGLLRFLPVYQQENREGALTSVLLTVFLIIALCTGILATAVFFIWTDGFSRVFIILGTLLLWSQAWFEISLEIPRSRLQPFLYGRIFLTKTVASVLLSATLAYMGYGAYGLLSGLIAGELISIVLFTRKDWGSAKVKKPEKQIVATLLTYGLPLTVSFILNFVINSSDRIMITWLLDSEATGLYSVGYDLSKQSLWVLMISINLASYPLAIKALEQRGFQAAQEQLARNAALLVGITLPTATGLAILAPNLAGVFLGESFQTAAPIIMPWIAFGALLGGFTNFYLVQSFQLGKNTKMQIWPFAAAAILNLVLNLLLLPVYGIVGAAYATVAAYFTNLILCWIIGKRIFPMPIPYADILKIIIATILMVFLLIFLTEYDGVPGLVLQIFAGALIYGAGAFLFNVAGVRSQLIAALRK